jgi:hypothetical protein
MDSATLLDWLKHHPDVARALVENRPGPGGSPAEDFLYSLTQPALYPAGADISGIDRDRVRTFFETMSPEDQKLLGALFPGVVGDLSGAPFDARDSGNYVRIVVAKEDEAAHIAALRDQLAQLSSINDPRVGSTEAAQDAIREQLALAEGRLGLYQGVLDHPERQIVLFDAAKGAFAEVSGVIGPSTKNIGVVVPGTGTNMAGIQGNVTAYSAFVEHAPPGELAMITWMGGGLPQSIFPDAFLDSSSRDLGPLLAEFSRDVRQEGAYAGAATPPQLTVAGHSYGGAVVGIAETYGVDADRILHVESPGMGNDVNSTADYHPLNPDVRRYAMTAPGRPDRPGAGEGRLGVRARARTGHGDGIHPARDGFVRGRHCGRGRRRPYRGDRGVAAQHGQRVVGSQVGHRGAGLGRRRPEVRQQDDVLELEQPRMHGRLVLEDVQPGARDLARAQRRHQRLLVDDRSAGRVDEVCRALHRAQPRGVHEVMGRGQVGAVQRHDVGRLEQLVERHLAGVQPLKGRGRRVVVIGIHDGHAERLGPPSHATPI